MFLKLTITEFAFCIIFALFSSAAECWQQSVCIRSSSWETTTADIMTDYYIIRIWPPNISKQTGLSTRFRFQGWTKDHRFAVFYSADHYGSNIAQIFNTLTWEMFSPSPIGVCELNPGDDCNESAVAIAPITDRILLIDGRLITLTDLTENNLQALSRLFPKPLGNGSPPWDGPGPLSAASWSPNEHHLVFIYWDETNSYKLGVANGDGSHAMFIAALGDTFGENYQFQWSDDGQTVNINWHDGIYPQKHRSLRINVVNTAQNLYF